MSSVAHVLDIMPLNQIFVTECSDPADRQSQLQWKLSGAPPTPFSLVICRPLHLAQRACEQNGRCIRAESCLSADVGEQLYIQTRWKGTQNPRTLIFNSNECLGIHKFKFHEIQNLGNSKYRALESGDATFLIVEYILIPYLMKHMLTFLNYEIISRKYLKKGKKSW